jgi:hypothetical protein
MAVRLLVYVGLLYQDLIKTGRVEANGLLPPVVPIVLYNGDQPWNAPQEISELVCRIPEELARYSPRLRYMLLDEGRYPEAELLPLRNLAAALFRLENSRTPEDVKQVIEALAGWLPAPEQASVRRAFTVWLKRVFLPGRMPGGVFDELRDLQEVHSMLSERVKEWTRDWKEQGRQEGRQEGEALFLLRLLERRFGVVDETMRHRVQRADVEILLTWGERVLTAKTLSEVFQD